MSRKYPEAYFKNQIEQRKISSAILGAIPTGVQYYNLVIVLTHLTETMLGHAFADEIYNHTPTNDPECTHETPTPPEGQ